jgi:hypothetical protein
MLNLILARRYQMNAHALDRPTAKRRTVRLTIVSAGVDENTRRRGFDSKRGRTIPVSSGTGVCPKNGHPDGGSIKYNTP